MALTGMAPASIYRSKEGLGVWEHRGKVAAVGIGHAPVDRRWDGRVETSVGSYAILAAQKALDDAGVSRDAVDGLVVVPEGLGDSWAPRPIPEDFAKRFSPVPDGNPYDGIDRISADWLALNMGLKNIRTAYHAAGCMSKALVTAAQVVGDGLASVCLVVRVLNNMEGRYQQSGINAQDTVSGDAVWGNLWGWGGIPQRAYEFDQYCRKYNSNHDRLAPFVLNQRRNGRMMPEGYYSQHPEPPLTFEDYTSARIICEPMVLHDCDRPVQTAVAYLITTAERARDMKQPPVYILNHCTNIARPRSGGVQTLEEIEASCDSMARKVYEGSGLTWRDIDVMNPYDGFTTFTQWYLEALHWHGVKRGEAHDFYAEDISVEGSHPFNSSGGNNGNGRTRCWMHTDSIQQLQRRAGERQVRIRAETALSGGPTTQSADWIVWSSSPS